jgi:DNA transposition AAA+ family ATPase
MFELVKEAVLNRLKTATQAKLAAQIGVAASTIDNLKNGRTDKVSDEMLRKLAAYFGIQESVNEFVWNFYETPQVQIINKSIQSAFEMKRMIGIVGNTGFGKTTALRDFQSENANCAYVLCDALMTQSDLAINIAKALGLQSDGKIRDILIRVTKYMIEKESILILDDASKLRNENFGLIQIIYDQTERRATIVLSGLQRLQSGVKHKAEKDKMNFREFYRRIAYWRELPPLHASTIKSIAGDYNLDKEVVKLLVSKCDNYGSLRNAIQNCWTWQGRNADEVLTREIASELID